MEHFSIPKKGKGKKIKEIIRNRDSPSDILYELLHGDNYSGVRYRISIEENARLAEIRINRLSQLL